MLCSHPRFPEGMLKPVPSEGTEIRIIEPNMLVVSCPVLRVSVCGPPSPVVQ